MQIENVKKTDNAKQSLQRFRNIALALLFALGCATHALAQVTNAAENTAFNSGETAQYDLYYNWHFVWVKAGSATMSVTTTTYEHEPAYRVRLLTRGSSQADRFWVLRDTLISIMSYDLLPLKYTKTDKEGDKYRVRHVWFSYKNGYSYARQQYINPYGEVSWKTQSNHLTIYDMLSILMRARSLDATKMQPGHKIKFVMTDGDGMSNETLIYRGKKKVKMRNGSGTYNCLVVSFVEYEKNKEKEVGTFYVTDDANHFPVAADLYLKIGTAKIFLAGYKNLKNPMKSKVK